MGKQRLFSTLFYLLLKVKMWAKRPRVKGDRFQHILYCLDLTQQKKRLKKVRKNF
jgi:hypothetical protein